MWRRILPTAILVASPLLASGRILHIEFFGYQGIDVAAVRSALPFQEGDQMSNDLAEKARAAVKRVTGRDATDFARICCAGDSDFVIFIGLPGSSSRAFTLNSAPQGNATVASELRTAYDKMNDAEMAAVKGGHAEEDGSPGYRLVKEPGARAAELSFREYALRHEDELIGVMDSAGNAHDRAMATDTLGYSERTPRQIAALVHAVRDADPDVRNNATRALMEILKADPSTASQIQPDAFIDMVRSGTWTDRNKASIVLLLVTASRDPQLFGRIKSEAGDALWEMARWRDFNWAFPARAILARTAGLPEDRVTSLAIGPVDAFLTAMGK